MQTAVIEAPRHEAVSRWTKIWRGFWMLVATAAVGGVVAYVLRPVTLADPGTKVPHKAALPAVQVVGHKLIHIDPATPFHKELTRTRVRPQSIAFPILVTTGSVLARIRPGEGSLEDRWEFSSLELTTTYADWLRTDNDIDYVENQLAKTRELADAETAYREATLARLKPLMQSGSIPEKDFKLAQSELLKAQLQGEKDVHGARSEMRKTLRTKTALERELSQAGIEPIVFSRAVEDMVLVVANVPEIRLSQVHVEQACEVRFYGYPDLAFPGHVEALSSSVTPERRTLRVLFDLNDPKQILRPGMFGEVSLGTEQRKALLIPAESLLHVERTDYVLVSAGKGDWRAQEVTTGELHDRQLEVLTGLSDNSEVIGNGAILLKPVLIQSLAVAPNTGSALDTGSEKP